MSSAEKWETFSFQEMNSYLDQRKQGLNASKKQRDEVRDELKAAKSSLSKDTPDYAACEAKFKEADSAWRAKHEAYWAYRANYDDKLKTYRKSKRIAKMKALALRKGHAPQDEKA